MSPRCVKYRSTNGCQRSLHRVGMSRDILCQRHALRRPRGQEISASGLRAVLEVRVLKIGARRVNLAICDCRLEKLDMDESGEDCLGEDFSSFRDGDG